MCAPFGCRPKHREIDSHAMRHPTAAVFFLLSLVGFGWAQSGSRSYVFTGVVRPADCALLPQSSLEVPPSLERASSGDRLNIQCSKLDDGQALLRMTFLLTDTPPALQPGESRRYSFRWGAKVPPDSRDPQAGEFTRDVEKCGRILEFLTKSAGARQSEIGPKWRGGCYAEDHWGLAMEITLTESSH